MPSDKTKDDFLLFLVYWKMAKLGKKPREIFHSIDKEGNGFINNKDFNRDQQNIIALINKGRIWRSFTIFRRRQFRNSGD